MGGAILLFREPRLTVSGFPDQPDVLFRRLSVLDDADPVAFDAKVIGRQAFLVKKTTQPVLRIERGGAQRVRPQCGSRIDPRLDPRDRLSEPGER
ncbi:hypothetical protein [Paraburkholderia sp. SIMBA_054]|uniref:hypothetical protein n=1 Tax=Paraburkholderia sp. SIMBA_054 TaxID=3085795 RepID=UPI00397E17F1